MKEKAIEPGLLRVFRGYSVLRLALGLAMLAFEAWQGQAADEVFHQESFAAILITLTVLFASIVYLFSPVLQKWLGGFYIPIAIAMATVSLFLEQYLLTPRSLFWQAESFFFILLIFVSWQHGMRGVILFSVGVALIDYWLNTTLQPTLFLMTRLPEPEAGQLVSVGRGDIFFWGRQLSRSLSFLILGLVITSLVNAQREQRKKLAEANRALVSHANVLEQLATSRERNRLSRELHDTVAHTLSGLTVQLQAFQTAWNEFPDRAAKIVEEMIQATRSGLDETRRTLKNLRAAPLDELGLALGIEALARDAASRKSLQLKVEVTKQNIELPQDVEHAFYRVAQESLENIVRHAQAKRIDLSLSRKNGRVELAISDDGVGFAIDQTPVDERWGLTLMRERAELVGASFNANSEPGKGTRIEMTY